MTHDVITREEVERIVREIAEKTLELKQEQAALDEEILAARKERDARIARLQAAIGERETQVKEWAAANRSTEFSGQSLALRHGVLSFRQGNWRVDLLAGWTWERALQQLKKLKLRCWIRTKPEIDKQKILAGRQGFEKEQLEALQKAGLCYARGESFSIEPKLETVIPLRQAA
jgi:phage host-nuclease inhibitor protein Gam